MIKRKGQKKNAIDIEEKKNIEISIGKLLGTFILFK